MTETPNPIEAKATSTFGAIRKDVMGISKRVINEADLKLAIESSIKNHIDEAFKDVSNDEQKALYRALSLKFHADRFAANDKEFFTYLQSHNLENAPQQYLAKYKDIDISIRKMAENPAEATKTLLQSFFERFGQELFTYKRYYQPIKAIVNIINWIINIALVLAVIAFIIVEAVVVIALLLAEKLHDVLFNKLTSGQYKQLKADYKNDEKRYIAKEAELKDAIPFIVAGYTSLGTPQSELDGLIEKYVKDNIVVDGTVKIKLMFLSIIQSIKQPLPESIIGKILTVAIVRPIQAVVAALLLPVAILGETLRFVNALLIVGFILSAIAIKAVSLAILNSPIYALDLMRYVINKGLSFVRPAAEKAASSESENKAGDSYQHMQNTMGTPGVGSDASAVNEAHYTSTGSNFFGRKPAAQASNAAPTRGYGATNVDDID